MANTPDPNNPSPEGPAQPASPPPTGAPPANPGYDANVFHQGLTDLYQKYYWRDPTAAEYETHKNNPQGLAGVEAMLKNTPNNSALTKPPAENTAPPATGSPVNATGQITPAPQQSYLPAPTPAQNGATPDQTRYVKPVDLSGVPNYQATNYNVAAPTAYQPTTYTPDQLSQYQSQPLMSAIMANPDTMNPNVVAQMKEAQKQQALLMAQQSQQGFDQSAVARGTLGGGFADNQRRQLLQNTNNSILDANRNTDITAAQTNRQNELDALGANASQFNTGLGAQQAQANLNQTGAQTNAQNQQAAFDSRFRNAGLNLQTQQAQAGENQYANTDAVSRLLQQFGVNTGVAQNAQQNYAADLGSMFGQNAFTQQNNQFAQNLGLQYDQLDQNGLLGYLNWMHTSGQV